MAVEFIPVPPIEVFAEALAVPPMLYVAPNKAKTVLTVGPYALPLAKLALRYPETERVLMVSIDESLVPNDKRIETFSSLDNLPQDTKADVVAIANRGDIPDLAGKIRKYVHPEGVVTVAVDLFKNGRAYKEIVAKIWPFVLPYREFTPEPALFFLLSNKKINRPLRPFPARLKRLTPRYLNNLFTLSKDEYIFLFGTPTSRGPGGGASGTTR